MGESAGWAGGAAAAVPGAVTSSRTPERSHPAGHDKTIVSTNSAPTATSVGPSTAMTVVCAAVPALIQMVRLRHNEIRSCAALRRVAAGDAAEHKAARKAVLGKPALGFAGAIEARDDLAMDIDHFGIGRRAQPGERIVQDRR